MARIVLLSTALLLPTAQAEKADRQMPVVIEADQPGTVDLARKIVVFNGKVVLTQGTLRIRSERMELRELPDGQRAATALGSGREQADFRERRDGVDEWVEGTADRIDYDGRSDVVKLQGRAVVRRLRGTQVADEVTGETITWDNRAEFFTVQAAPAGAAPAGRVRAVITPPPAASAPASRP